MIVKSKVYYSEKDFILYLGDCKEILSSFPSKSVDLIITDPPYGMKYHSGHYKGKNPFNEIVGDNSYPVEVIPQFSMLARKAIFMFCRWDNLKDVPQPKSFISMVKNNWTAGDLKRAFGRQWEGILFYPQEKFEFNKRLPDVIDCRRVPPKQLLHPTQKALEPIELLIENCSKEGDVILDPYCGSGTTLVAARKLNRKAIGIEIDEDYAKVAMERIKS